MTGKNACGNFPQASEIKVVADLAQAIERNAFGEALGLLGDLQTELRARARERLAELHAPWCVDVEETGMSFGCDGNCWQTPNGREIPLRLNGTSRSYAGKTEYREARIYLERQVFRSGRPSDLPDGDLHDIMFTLPHQNCDPEPGTASEIRLTIAEAGAIRDRLNECLAQAKYDAARLARAGVEVSA